MLFIFHPLVPLWLSSAIALLVARLVCAYFSIVLYLWCNVARWVFYDSCWRVSINGLILVLSGFLHSHNRDDLIVLFWLNLLIQIIDCIVRLIYFKLVFLLHIFHYSIILSWSWIIIDIIFTVIIAVSIVIINVIGIGFFIIIDIREIILHACDV